MSDCSFVFYKNEIINFSFTCYEFKVYVVCGSIRGDIFFFSDGRKGGLVGENNVTEGYPAFFLD